MSPRLPLAALAFAIASTAYAHTAATGIVKERMDGMVVLSQSMKAVIAQTQSTNPDVDAIKDAASAMQAHAGDAMTDRFPKGSLDHPSEATEAIWKNWDRFTFLAQQLDLKAKGLELAAGNPITGKTVQSRDNFMLMDFAAMGPDEVFSLIGMNCKACHQDFRVKKK